jgi:hypothetical protein
VVLELGGRATDGASESKVCAFENLVIEDGTEDEDDGSISVGERGDRVESNPALDLRPIGVKSKFWALSDDDDSDKEIAQSPYMPDLVRQAAVHGFSKQQLVEAEMALQDSSIQRRVEAFASPAASDKKVLLVRDIIKAWTAARRSLMAP